jgi:hypothetical protein
MDKPQFWARRKFINKQGWHSSAHYIVSVKATEGVTKRDGITKPWRHVDASFRLTDCSRAIDLDFDLGTYEDDSDRVKARENSLYKARLLRAVVNDFVDHLEAGAAWLESFED